MRPRLCVVWLGLALAGAASAQQSERARTLGPFLSSHWESLPLTAQGEAPEAWSEAERSLDPAACGICHPLQLQQWRGSLHAGAFSPGFSGQLLEGALATPEGVRACQGCHAPLAEQQPGSAAFDAGLRARGLVCAACHVRGYARLGPPRRAGLPPAPAPLPHGGFREQPEFQESRFCAPCHQFFDDPGVGGKPVENTFREWQESAFAAAGRQCQDCHMPERAHTWRGIHDPDLVRAAVDVALVPGRPSAERVEAKLVLSSREVGHFLPTYVTPRVYVAAWQEDSAGRELEDTRIEATIGRRIDFSVDPPVEVFDTRIAPGKTVKLDYSAPRHADAAQLVGRVTVDPDYHYRGLFESLLEGLSDPEARARIAEALGRTTESTYVLRELRQPLEP